MRLVKNKFIKQSTKIILEIFSKINRQKQDGPYCICIGISLQTQSVPSLLILLYATTGSVSSVPYRTLY